MGIRHGEWPEGAPAWADALVDSVVEARDFYRDIFGWEAPVGPPEAGGYRMALRDGYIVAGLGPKVGQAVGMPSAWTMYFAASDCDKLAEVVEVAGGKTLVPPVEVRDVGRLALFADPDGAVFGAWQARSFDGAQLTREAGSMCWHELRTPNYQGARQFYSDVFGYHYTAVEDDDGQSYAMCMLPGTQTPVVGLMSDNTDASVKAQWMTWFAVENCVKTVKRARAQGAKTVAEPMEAPQGTAAVLRAPQGEIFGVISAAR